MPMKREIKEIEKERLVRGTVRLNAKIIGLTLGLLLGLGIFLATNWLVIKGGKPAGRNLSLLGQYFIGYRVSFLGSLIGFAYGFALGTLVGGLIGWSNSLIARLRRRRDLY
jgi:hypothetical protein